MGTDILLLRDMDDAQRVKVGRTIKQWTQAQCAVYSDVPLHMLSYLERGYTIPKTKRRAIFEALDLDPGNE